MILKLNYNFSILRNFLFFYLFIHIISDYMHGEIDLETYTISIIRLNSAFQKLENIDEVKEMFKESYNDLQRIYLDIVTDLNQNNIILNEYYLFFQNGKQTFPQYIDVLSNIHEKKLQEEVNLLINLFSNLNKIADGFSRSDENELRLK